MLWLNISRLNLLYAVIEVIIYFIVGNDFISPSFIIFMLVSYFLILIIESSFFLYFYLKVRELESVWDNSSIHKLNIEKKTWIKTPIRQLKVGDLILLKRNTVAPADVLIIDTSENHFSDQILYTNERRVTGQNIMTTKRAVKNLRGKNQSKNQYEVLKHILPSLEGQIEYEAPSDNVSNFTGQFKLINDPQISRISHKNMLFCGTQLHTSWMIGLVLFTGQNTKILQMNMEKMSKFEKIIKEIKTSKTSQIINYLMAIYLILSIILTAIYYTLRFFRSKNMEVNDMLEEFVAGSTSRFIDFLLVWQGSLLFVPQFSVLLYEISCFVIGIQIQRRSSKERKLRMEAVTKSIQEMTVYVGRRFSRKKSSKLSSSDSFNLSENQRFSLSSDDRFLSNPHVPRGRRSHTITGSTPPINSLVAVQSGSRGLRRGNSVAGGSRVTSKKRSLTGFVEATDNDVDTRGIRVINYEALPCLGSITHVVFDKTDTLTLSTMHVCQISTIERIYKVENEQRLKELMDLYDSNPQAFEFEEDIEENKAQENSFYSEKSQEYLREINGEYVAEVQDSDSLEEILTLKHPSYNFTGKTTMIQGDKTGSEDGSFNSMNLKKIKSSSGPTQFAISKPPNPTFEEDDSFVELGLLEKEFKKTYQLKSEGSSEESSSEKDVLSVIRHRLRIKINNDKLLSDKHLVADIRQRDESLEEVLRYVYILHLIQYGNQNQEERSLKPEDEALINVINGLGFFQNYKKKQEVEKQDIPPIFTFDYETVGGLKLITSVFSMSIFSQRRGRRSIIINAEPSDNDPYLLITFGSEKSMKNLIRPSRNKKEDNLLKVMIAKQKQRGYKLLIVCKKGLSEEQVLTYTKEYAKISSSARDQLEDLETLATQIENDLEYVGCIGLRDSIREEAIDLTMELNKSRITMSIMSGDELENCLTVVNKLGFSFIDIQNSSSYFTLNAATEKSIMQQMRRIFDSIHDNLQTESYMYIENLLKTEREPLPEGETIRNQEKKETQDQDEDKENQSVIKKPTTFDAVKKFKKPLLLGGAAVECIMEVPSLAHHLAAIFFASGTIVAYDLMPKHKAFLIGILQRCGEIVLAVGDGFNDIGMLRRANLGIQISNENVPLIFGDIVTPSLSNISPLIYEYGFQLKKNLLISFIMIVWLSCLTGLFPIFMAYYSYLLPFMSINGLTIASLNMIYPVLTIFTIVNECYDLRIIKKLPIIYKENVVLFERVPNIMVIVATWAILESTLITLPAVFFINQDINSRGFSSVVWNCSDLYINYLLFSLLAKVILVSKKDIPTLLWVIIPGIVLIVVSIFSFDDTSRVLIGYSKWQSFSYPSFNFSLTILIIGLNYLSYILIAFMKKRYFYPVSTLFKNHSNEEDESLTNDKVMELLSEMSLRSKQELYIQVINSMKLLFTKASKMDPSLRRIINIDFHHSNMGLSKVYNEIVDEDERKRFLEYIKKNLDHKRARYFFGIMAVLGVVEWIIHIFINQTSWVIALDTMAPYITLAMTVNFVFSFAKPKFLPYSLLGTQILQSHLRVSPHRERHCLFRSQYSIHCHKQPHEAPAVHRDLQDAHHDPVHMFYSVSARVSDPVVFLHKNPGVPREQLHVQLHARDRRLDDLAEALLHVPAAHRHAAHQCAESSSS